MNSNAWLPIAILFSSLAPGLIIFFLKEESWRLRTTLNLAGAVGKLLLIGVMVRGLFGGLHYQAVMPFLPGLDLVLRADSLAVLFATLSGLLWLLTTIYAVGYLEQSPNRSRFFGFFSLCVSATVGVALAGNLLTFLIFYEMLTLATYPLVVHRGTREALAAGRVYLFYTVAGGAALLVGTLWLWLLGGNLDFIPGGVLAGVAADEWQLRLVFGLLIVGLGVKAALVPLHGWLPVAMIAPAPVSALLHAVAVVKAGAFGIVRVVYDLFGSQLCARLEVLTPLALLASLTIIYGSLQALRQENLKRRLAYSTVSQVSYIILGVGLGGPTAALGGLVHLVHQGLMKITLFFCAGNLAETLGLHQVGEMAGTGRRMPWTMAAFTVAALGMIGLPPLAGFVSKWYLGWGALAMGHPWALAVLAVSSLLNAAYFLPLLHAVWFQEPANLRRRDGRPASGRGVPPAPSGGVEAAEEAVSPVAVAGPPLRERRAAGWSGPLETRYWMLLLPPLVTALLVLLAGIFAHAPFSPLAWVRLIVSGEF